MRRLFEKGATFRTLLELDKNNLIYFKEISDAYN